MTNPSIYTAFERFWQHVVARLNTFISDEELAVVENKIPTAVSQLLNDSNFVDNTYIPSQILNSNQNG